MLRHFCGIVVLLLCTLLFCEYLIHFQIYSNPSCHWPASEAPRQTSKYTSRRRPVLAPTPKTLRALVIADLHIIGAKGGYFDKLRREWFMKRAFERALAKLRPEMVLVLGDISDDGSRATDEEWQEIVRRFRKITGRPSELPLHVVAGNHDIGDHDHVKEEVIQRFANTFAARSPTSSSLFQWENISFVSLNAMTMLGDGCPFCSGVDNVVEMASRRLFGEAQIRANLDLPPDGQLGSEPADEAEYKEFANSSEASAEGMDTWLTKWHPGPVLLLHLPLHRTSDSSCEVLDTPRCGPWHQMEGSCLDINAPANMPPPPQEPYRPGLDVLTRNATQYVLKALRPRIVFTAHTHRYCERLHNNTKEVTVPTFSWRNRDDPSFLLAAFHPNGTVTTTLCPLPRESIVLGTYAIVGMIIFLWLTVLAAAACCCRHREHAKED